MTQEIEAVQVKAYNFRKPRDDYRQAELNRRASSKFNKMCLDSRNWQSEHKVQIQHKEKQS